jgi:hypothetical protein
VIVSSPHQACDDTLGLLWVDRHNDHAAGTAEARHGDSVRIQPWKAVI